jgi:cytochrome c oxidase subunit 3
MAATAMVFLAFIAVFAVRRGNEVDAAGVPLPPILWTNTAILLGSSAGLEFARRSLRRGQREWFTPWWVGGTLLGYLFLAGQAQAWRELTASGVYIGDSIGSAIFYILTGAHAFHLIGAVIALSYVAVHALRLHLGPAKRTTADASAFFWHFLAATWIGVVGVFIRWS